MKKVLLRIFSAILALVCLFGAWACGVSVKDELDCKEIWKEIREEALANFDLMDAGIAELAANSDVYADGVGTYRAGLGTYNAGRAELAAGKAKLETGQAAYDANSAKLSEAHKAYDEGVAAIAAGKIELEQGKKELEEGKATLAANKEAYEEGKAQLAKVQPIYAIVKPLHNQYVNLQQQYEKAVAEGDNDRAAVLAIEVAAAKRIFEAELANTGYSMDSLVAEYEAGQAKIAEYEAGQKKVAEGEKKIAEAEATIAAGEKKLAESKIALDENDLKLAEAKKALDAGYADYAAGQSRLAAGAAQLAAGAAQLAVFEGGQQQIAETLDLVIGTETYRNAEGKAQVKSIASRLGKNFTYWLLDENGEIVVLNDEPVVDLEKAALVVQAGRDFVDDTTEVVTAEIITRVILTVVAALACLAGVAAAILGLCAVAGASATLGVIAFALSLGGIIAINLFGGNEYPMSRIVGSEVTGLVLLTMAAVAVAAVINTVMAFICDDDAQKPAETPEAPAQAEQSEPVAVN